MAEAVDSRTRMEDPGAQSTQQAIGALRTAARDNQQRDTSAMRSTCCTLFTVYLFQCIVCCSIVHHVHALCFALALLDILKYFVDAAWFSCINDAHAECKWLFAQADRDKHVEAMQQAAREKSKVEQEVQSQSAMYKILSQKYDEDVGNLNTHLRLVQSSLAQSTAEVEHKCAECTERTPTRLGQLPQQQSHY